MLLWCIAGGHRASGGHHHGTVHARVHGARVAVLARPVEPVGPSATSLVLRGEAVARHVVEDRVVLEAPGDLGPTATWMAGGRNRKRLATTSVTPLTGVASAARSAWQAAVIMTTSASRPVTIMLARDGTRSAAPGLAHRGAANSSVQAAAAYPTHARGRGRAAGAAEVWWSGTWVMLPPPCAIGSGAPADG